ncbi:MAG: folylpolyglutamate synthase/dihydrofolate synthase family protein [Saprospiraceae bacterium]
MTLKEEYAATLRFLYEELPMYQREGKTAFKNDLSNIIAFCQALAQPQEKFPSIHLAGTNGKGSTAHLISAVLQAKGYKVGLYTSPHYRDFRERIKLNGEYIDQASVIDFVNKHRALFAKLQPSFFEVTVAMAFDYFAQEKVDFAVIETGLGGRLDSTNVIQPILSVITNISLDHQHILGDTLPLIAKEKAGIIKAGVPVIIGERQAETTVVFTTTAAEKQAELIFASDELTVECLTEDLTHSHYKIQQGQQVLFSSLAVNLHGPFQAKNLCTALRTIIAFEKWQGAVDLDLEAVEAGLKNLKTRTNYIGRWQVLQNQPRIVADSAHNEAGLAIAMKKLADLPYQQLHIVMGMVNDKSIAALLRHFPRSAQYYFAKAALPRALAAASLQEQAAAFGLQGKAYPSVKEALEEAKLRAGVRDFIYVGGSSFVVGEVI